MIDIRDFRPMYAGEIRHTCLMLRPSHDCKYFLFTALEQPSFGIYLEGDNRFKAFRTENNATLAGVVFDDFSIEVDESSIISADSGFVPLGTLTIENGNICIQAVMTNRSDYRFAVPLRKSEPTLLQIGFTKWRMCVRRRMETDASLIVPVVAD